MMKTIKIISGILLLLVVTALISNANDQDPAQKMKADQKAKEVSKKKLLVPPPDEFIEGDTSDKVVNLSLPLIFPYSVYQKKLLNGLNVVTVPYQSPGIAAFYIVVRTGSEMKSKKGKQDLLTFLNI